MRYELREGSQEEKPKTIDTTSSSSVVYLRKNIRQITKVDEVSGEEITLWQYEEAVISHNEYDEYAASQQAKVRSDIDFIAMMVEVDLDE